MNRSLIERASGSLSLKALPALYGAALILLVVRVLPLGDFGRYGMTIAYVNLMASVTRGLWAMPLVIHAARGDRSAFVGPALAMSLLTALAGAALGQIILPLLGVGRNLALIAGIMQVCLAPRDVALALLQSQRRAWSAFTVEAGYFIGSLIGFAALTLAGRLTTAEAALSVNLAAAILSTMIAVIFQRETLTLRWSGDRKGLFRLGKWIGMLALGELFLQQGDLLIIGAFFSAEAVAPYIAARTLLRLYGLFSQAVNFFVLPGASRLGAEGQIEYLRHRLRTILRMMLGILVPVNAAVWLLSPILFPLVLGAKYEPAIPLFQILILATFCEPVYSVLTNALAGIGKTWVPVPVLGIALIVNVILNVILLPIVGLTSAAVVLVATYVVLAYGSYRMGQKHLHDAPPTPA
ncbi:MAG: oligosaccharide flippase family protein [bacterium]|nr:oligosaccharide flippase family protein [bacterium]